MHVIGDAADALRLAPLYAALEATGAVEQIALSVEPGAVAGLWRELLDELRPSRSGGADLHEWPRLAQADTAASLLTAEIALPQLRPAVVIVGGPSDAALGWALAAAKLRVPVASAEAGLRDYDWGCAAEINRVLLDTIADSLYAPTRDAAANLVREGIDAGRVHHAGPTVVDAVRRLSRKAGALAAWRGLGIQRGAYVLAVLDELGDAGAEDERIARTTESLAALARRLPVVLPLDHRGRARLAAMGDLHRLSEAGVRCVPSGSYLSSLSLKWGAGAVVTDAGVVQDETTALGVACFTLRASSERTVTVTHGTNVLLGRDARDVADLAVLAREPVPAAIPKWDGRAARRIARSLVSSYALVPVRRALLIGHEAEVLDGRQRGAVAGVRNVIRRRALAGQHEVPERDLADQGAEGGRADIPPEHRVGAGGERVPYGAGVVAGHEQQHRRGRAGRLDLSQAGQCVNALTHLADERRRPARAPRRRRRSPRARRSSPRRGHRRHSERRAGSLRRSNSRPQSPRATSLPANIRHLRRRVKGISLPAGGRMPSPPSPRVASRVIRGH